MCRRIFMAVGAVLLSCVSAGGAAKIVPTNSSQISYSIAPSLRGVVLNEREFERVKRGHKLSRYVDHRNGIRNALFWHHTIPTTGLRDVKKPVYPFIPHLFSLWELAPHKGAGVRVAVIDTGVSAFDLHKKGYKRHSDLRMNERWMSEDLNVVSRKGTGKRTILQSLPLVHVTPQSNTYVLGHGNHVFGLIGGELSDPDAVTPEHDHGICGLAPRSDVVMVRAFDDKGVSTHATLQSALRKTIEHRADVVNLSLKIDQELSRASRRSLENILKNIPYSVAASGNAKKPTTLPYPARSSYVAFSVGAFGYNERGEYPILASSIYEPGVGPLVVAPGYNVVSSGLAPYPQKHSMFSFMSGTSIAAPLMSGFMALVLGEFKGSFTKDQLLRVIYASTVKLHNDKAWHEKTVLGTVDMRLALCMVHALARIREALVRERIPYDVAKKFDHVVLALRTIFMDGPSSYGKQVLGGSVLSDDYADYLRRAQQVSQHDDMVHQFPWMKSGDLSSRWANAFGYIEQVVLASFGHASSGSWRVDEGLVRQVRSLLHRRRVHLFDHESVKQRLAYAV